MPVRKMPSNVPAPPIEATGAPRPRDLVEVGEVGADQRAQPAGDIGERRRPLARQHQRRDRGGERRGEHRHRDADARHRIGEPVHDHGDDRGRDRAGHPQIVFRQQIDRHHRRDHGAADIDGDQVPGQLLDHRHRRTACRKSRPPGRTARAAPAVAPSGC